MSVQIRIIRVNRHTLFVTIPFALMIVPGPVEFIIFRIKIRLCPVCPVFFVTSFILLKIFIVLNKRKNWETGQKCENPLIFLGFLLPTFVLKTGQKLGRKWAEALFQCFLPFIFQQKLGRNWPVPTFWNIKLGRNWAISR